MRFNISIDSLIKILAEIEDINEAVILNFEKLIYDIIERDCIIYYNYEVLFGISESEYLFGTNDNSKLLLKILNRSIKVSDQEDEHIAKIGFDNGLSSVICNLSDLNNYFKKKLLTAVSNQEIIELLMKLYIELIFLNNINSSINFINMKDENNVEKICSHLEAINTHFSTCFDTHKTKGLKVVIKEFKDLTGIDSSCENNRRVVKDYRTIKLTDIDDYRNSIDEQFELHTKLDISDFKERIYFSKGQNVIQKNKIIIAHIGKHLYDPNSGFKHNYSKLPKTEFLKFKDKN